jgi:hypothetical protein
VVVVSANVLLVSVVRVVRVMRLLNIVLNPSLICSEPLLVNFTQQLVFFSSLFLKPGFAVGDTTLSLVRRVFV